MVSKRILKAQLGTPLTQVFGTPMPAGRSRPTSPDRSQVGGGPRPDRAMAGLGARAGATGPKALPRNRTNPTRPSLAGRLTGPFLSPGSLSPRERLVLIEGMETILGGACTHLPLKRARYGFDPIQRLRILRTQIDELTDDAFHAELADIVTRLRDAHTRYVGPVSLGGHVAILPFLGEMAGSSTPMRSVLQAAPCSGAETREPSVANGRSILPARRFAAPGCSCSLPARSRATKRKPRHRSRPAEANLPRRRSLPRPCRKRLRR